MSSPSHLYFPPELWSLTVQNFCQRKSPDDLTYLWTTVRHVSRQFKTEIETIFLTEHLPKTWLHVNAAMPSCSSPNSSNVFDFNFKLRFEKTHPRYPGMAVFTLRSENDNQERPLPRISASRRKTFKKLRDEVGAGKLGEIDKSVPGSRIRLFESPVGMFVVQVRGSVSDCALPALNIKSGRYELSFDWMELFDRFFGERKVTTTVLHGAPVGHAPANSKGFCDYNPAPQDSATYNRLVNQLNPSLHAIAQLDKHTRYRHMQVSWEGTTRVERLNNPIQAWTEVMGEEIGQPKATIRRCRLRRQADGEIDLDDEGAINKERLDWEFESNEAAASNARAEWYPLTRACDTCRTINRQCEREDDRDHYFGTCKYCVEVGSPCDCSLATLNRTLGLSPDFHVQPNQMRVCAAGNHALQDYQMQLMLLEHQKKKRRLEARQQPNSMGLMPSTSQPMLSSSQDPQPPINAFQDYHMQERGLREPNEQRFPEPRHAAADGGQILRAGPSQPAQDNQARIPVQRYEEQPLEARRDHDAFRPRVQPQPFIARGHFATMPNPVSASPTQSDRRHHPTDPSQSVIGLCGDSSTPVPALE